MTPAEEDALVEKCYQELANVFKPNHRGTVREAIRAAVAAERERREQLEDALREIAGRHKATVKMGGPEPCRCKTCAIANRALIGEA